MSVEHSCFLELAKISIENAGEHWTRNAISRAYYSMFHSAMRVINGKIPVENSAGEKIPGGTHQRLYSYFCDGSAANAYKLDPIIAKKLGMKLKNQHYHRVKADYKLTEKVNRINALSCIKDAEEVNELVLKLINPPSKS